MSFTAEYVIIFIHCAIYCALMIFFLMFMKITGFCPDVIIKLLSLSKMAQIIHDCLTTSLYEALYIKTFG